ncbi:sugar lactone lactonase YvrE [Streptomyces sp. V3I8]|uniref:hypothetical protein n=1 Tax=Streptomyces sp. V3I8 TaxID=3042279 RepID=UPI0027807C9C|nr:hypothetical protein [Streptomyces sp. V3I8]MDQ1039997.1 sugar lactone lactonase YvrE [Streptomyces sp. V3I8]
MSNTGYSRRGVLGAAAALAATSAVGAAPSAAAAAGNGPAVVTGHADALHPEGVVWDARRNAFLVSSTRHGTASIVDIKGRVTPLVTDIDPRVVSSVGIAADPARNRLLLGCHDFGLGARSTPETFGAASYLAVYDLRTGRRRGLVDLKLGPEPMHAADRIAIAPDGTAYVSDPAANKIYQVTVDGEASVLVDSAVIAPGWQVGTGAGVIGILLHPRGFLLTLHYSTGRLVRIPLDAPERATAVTLDRPIVGGDSVVLRPDGTLLVVGNNLAAPTGVDAVVVLRPTCADWTAAHEIRRVEPWPEVLPTDIADTPYGAYAISGRPDLLGQGLTTDEFVLRRL